ncbi:MAG: DUF3825 domain-containing protein [Bacteroidota bacterium]|nr:DUF3825 domain-containing protein [Bacteroidota bacterium]
MEETLPEEKKKNPLFEFAYLGKTEVLLNTLKDLAMPEKWEYTTSPNKRPLPILFSYLIHTFVRVQEEGKILKSDKYTSFNTGLVTPNQEEIFMLFKERPESGDLYFLEFCKESGRNMARFCPLPERPSYFTDVSELFFDFKLKLRVNIDHIVEDPNNTARFPENIQQLPKHQLINTFKGALDHAIKRIQRNYKTAVPQYYRGPSFPTGQLQLLIPLCLTDPVKADLALAIYKAGDAYVGRTCLTLDMAMNNARLITKPDDDWLNP